MRNFDWRGGLKTTAPDFVSTDIWYHLAGVFDGSTWKIYLDGDLESSGNLSGSITTQAGPLYIGHEDAWTNENFYGIVDDLRIFHRALTESEIEDIVADSY